MQQILDDLNNDIKELENDIRSYTFRVKATKYFLEPPPKISEDSVSFYVGWLFWSETSPVINNIGYEVLKNTSRLDIIQNKQILSNLIRLYEEDYKILLSTTQTYIELKRNLLFPYYLEKITTANEQGQKNTFNYLQDPKFKKLVKYNFPEEIKQRYIEVLESHKTLKALIEQELN